MNREKKAKNNALFLSDDAEVLNREMSILFSSSHLDLNDAVVEAFERNPVLVTDPLKKKLLSKVLNKIGQKNNRTVACLIRLAISDKGCGELVASLGIKEIAFRRFLSGDVHFTNIFSPGVLLRMVNRVNISTQIFIDKIRQELNALIASESTSTSVLARAKVGILDSEKAKQSDSARMDVEKQYKQKIQVYLDEFNREVVRLSQNI